MMHASYIYGSSVYEIRLICDDSHIDGDVDTVQSVITDTDEQAYKENMRIAVNQKLAFDIWKDGERKGFVYNRIDSGGRYVGCSIWIRDVHCMILALKTMFELCNKANIRFYPHEGNVRDFVSMATGTSLRRHYAVGDAVVFNRKELAEKGYKAFHYIGFKHGWSNL